MASLTQFEYVIAVDQCRHFGRAAELCHVSQPTLSGQLQKLEEEFGVILFDRNKKPTLPTEEGRFFIEQIKVIMNEYKRLQMLAKHNAKEPSGEFKLGIIPTVAPYLIPVLLEHFIEKYKDIDLIIEEMPTDKIIESLDRDFIDAGILATPLQVSRIEEEPLYYEPFYLYISANHKLAGISKVSENMLSANEILLLSDEHCLRNQVLEVCRDKKKKEFLPGVEFKGGSLETLIELVARGHGYTLLPQMAADLIKKRKFDGKIIEFSRPTPAREISLVHRRGHLKQGILKVLKQSIDENMPDQLPRSRGNSLRILGASVINR